MADMNLSGNATSPAKRKLHTTRVDLTPMVDLGFLLITFFVFTTTMASPGGMNVIVPANGDSTEVRQSEALTFILTAPDSVCYYRGADLGNRKCISNSPTEVRSIIRQTKASLEHPADLVVLIRPTDSATLGNVVDMLDEMVIMNVKRYVLMSGN